MRALTLSFGLIRENLFFFFFEKRHAHTMKECKEPKKKNLMNDKDLRFVYVVDNDSLREVLHFMI